MAMMIMSIMTMTMTMMEKFIKRVWKKVIKLKLQRGEVEFIAEHGPAL
jgi:hypothetical protein